MIAILAVIAIPVLYLVIFVFLRHPRAAVFAIVCIQYSNFAHVMSTQYQFKLFNLLATGLALGLVVCYRIIYPPKGHGSSLYFVLLATWLLAAIISLINSEAAPVNTDPLYRTFVEYLTGVGVLLLLVDWGMLVAAAAAITTTCVALSLLTIVQFLLGPPYQTFGGFAEGSTELISGTIHAWRPGGTQGDPNFYSQMLLPGLAFAFTWAMSISSNKVRVLGIVASGIIIAAILLSASRGALVAGAVMFVCVALVHRKIASVIGLVVIMAFAGLFAPESYQARLIKPFEALTNSETDSPAEASVGESSITGRLNEMKAAYLLFLGHPLTGVGYGQFESYYQEVSIKDDLIMRPKDRSAHSLYLETASEQGVVGMLTLIIILIVVAVAVARSYLALGRLHKHDMQHFSFAVGSAVLGYFSAAIFLHDAYPRYVWIIFALVFSMDSLVQGFVQQWRAGATSGEVNVNAN